MKSKKLFGDISQQQFLAEYWQQKPLLVRQAFPGIRPPFSPEELAGLSCDTDAPSRIIIEHGETPWQVINAPLEEKHFLNTPENHWTLLVNDLERYYPELLTLVDNFRFIPDWRIDDLMVSYATDGGSVGPHVDQYDVFLIQAAGQRHWMLDADADSSRFLPNIELNILSEFHSKQDWVLDAGDMLYLPPHLAHYGIAKGDDCMTYSVGFRAPSQQELLESWLDHLLEKKALGQRYRDPHRATQIKPGKLEQTDITAIKQLMLEALQDENDRFTHWLGSYLTEVKNTEQEEFIIDDHLGPEIAFFRKPSSRLAWVENDNDLTLFINGEASKWPKQAQHGIEYICVNYQYPSESLEEELQDESFRELFQSLIDQEIVFFSSHCDEAR